MHSQTNEGWGTILVVEDDEQVRSLICTLLRNQGYAVLEAESGADGLRVAEQNIREIDLMISDMLLPELSGFDLAVQLRSKYPQLAILFMTGYVEGDIVQRCLTELKAGFMDKPFAPAALLKEVRVLMAKSASASS